MRKQVGVTLVELLTVLLIVSILAAIAVPGYGAYVRKARRADAKVALTSSAQQFERCYTRYNKYTDPGCQVVLPYNTPNATYTIDADPAAVPTAGVTANTFAIKATPLGNQTKDTQCATYTLNQASVHGVSGTSAVADCW
jgi:type IV pilus assembly protein PilE